MLHPASKHGAWVSLSVSFASECFDFFLFCRCRCLIDVSCATCHIRMEPLGVVQWQFLRIPLWTLPFAQMGGETNEFGCDCAFVARGCRGGVHRSVRSTKFVLGGTSTGSIESSSTVLGFARISTGTLIVC